MTAQPQLVQGCTICGVPSDPESEMRETAAGGRLGGGGLSFGDFSLATQRKVTRPGPKGGRNAVEGSALAFHAAKPHQGAYRWLVNPARVRRRGTDYFLRCNAQCLLHPTVCHCVAKPFNPRMSEYAVLFEPTASHHIVNLRGTLTPLTIALSQGERGQRRRERQQAGKRKGAGQAPFDTLIG